MNESVNEDQEGKTGQYGNNGHVIEQNGRPCPEIFKHFWDAFWWDEKLNVDVGDRFKHITVWDINKYDPDRTSYGKSKDEIT